MPRLSLISTTIRFSDRNEADKHFYISRLSRHASVFAQKQTCSSFPPSSAITVSLRLLAMLVMASGMTALVSLTGTHLELRFVQSLRLLTRNCLK